MPTPQLDLGKLLRLDEMVMQATQTEAVRDSAAALVHAYDGLRNEIIEMLKTAGLDELHNEAFQAFPAAGVARAVPAAMGSLSIRFV